MLEIELTLYLRIDRSNIRNFLTVANGCPNLLDWCVDYSSRIAKHDFISPLKFESHFSSKKNKKKLESLDEVMVAPLVFLCGLCLCSCLIHPRSIVNPAKVGSMKPSVPL